MRWRDDHTELWEVVEEHTAQSLPVEDRVACVPGLGEEGPWYRRLDRRERCDLAALPSAWLEGDPVIDFRDAALLGSDVLAQSESGATTEYQDRVRVPIGAADVSAGAGVSAGIALGWWRDPRSLWRKTRAAQPFVQWRERMLQARDS